MKKYKTPDFISLEVKLERGLLVLSGTSGDDEGDISGEGIDWEDDANGNNSIIGEGIDWFN